MAGTTAGDSRQHPAEVCPVPTVHPSSVGDRTGAGAAGSDRLPVRARLRHEPIVANTNDGLTSTRACGRVGGRAAALTLRASRRRPETAAGPTESVDADPGAGALGGSPADQGYRPDGGAASRCGRPRCCRVPSPTHSQSRSVDRISS